MMCFDAIVGKVIVKNQCIYTNHPGVTHVLGVNDVVVDIELLAGSNDGAAWSVGIIRKEVRPSFPSNKG
jgi:hypothetical protein